MRVPRVPRVAERHRGACRVRRPSIPRLRRGLRARATRERHQRGRGQSAPRGAATPWRPSYEEVAHPRPPTPRSRDQSSQSTQGRFRPSNSACPPGPLQTRRPPGRVKSAPCGPCSDSLQREARLALSAAPQKSMPRVPSIPKRPARKPASTCTYVRPGWTKMRNSRRFRTTRTDRRTPRECSRLRSQASGPLV